MPRMRFGTNPELEAEANALLKASMAGITKFSEKSDSLTPWKQENRREREILVPSGTPDPANRQGLYHRRRNIARPDLNSRGGAVKGGRGGGGLSAFMEENGAMERDDSA